MTREEAVEVIKAYRDKLTHSVSNQLDGDIEAFNMAIKALEQEPYFWEKCPYYEPDIMFDGKDEYDMGKCTYKQEPCEDAISRQDALNCIRASGFKKFDFILDARDKIKNLPSVKPQEPKIGHWEICQDDDGMYGICNICGQDSDFTHYGEVYKYCPNCGAKMKSEVQE